MPTPPLAWRPRRFATRLHPADAIEAQLAGRRKFEWFGGAIRIQLAHEGVPDRLALLTVDSYSGVCRGDATGPGNRVHFNLLLRLITAEESPDRPARRPAEGVLFAPFHGHAGPLEQPQPRGASFFHKGRTLFQTRKAPKAQPEATEDHAGCLGGPGINHPSICTS